MSAKEWNVNARHAMLVASLAGLGLSACGRTPVASPANPMPAATAAPAVGQAPDQGGTMAAGVPVGTVYGAGVTLPTSMTVSELITNIARYDGQRVRVEGLITGVCPMRGCWIDIAGDQPGQTVRFKAEEGVIVFPLEVKGKHAVVEGIARKMSAPAIASPGQDSPGSAPMATACDVEKALAPVKVQIDAIGAVVNDRT
jgi:hypothetical protein